MTIKPKFKNKVLYLIAVSYQLSAVSQRRKKFIRLKKPKRLEAKKVI